MTPKEDRYRRQRAADVAQELSAMFGIEMTPKMQLFFDAAYTTAVYDIADSTLPGIDRAAVLDGFLWTPPKDATPVADPPRGAAKPSRRGP